MNAPVTRDRRFPWPLIVVLVALGVVFGGMRLLQSRQRLANSGVRHPAVGQVLPAFSLTRLDAEQATLGREVLQGKVTLINFWAPWCGPCRIEFPEMVAMYERHRSQPRFQFFSVTTPAPGQGLDELLRSTEDHLQRYKASFPAYLDDEDAMFWGLNAAANTSGGIPLTVLVGPNESILGVWEGYASGDEVHVEQALVEALQASESPTSAAQVKE